MRARGLAPPGGVVLGPIGFSSKGLLAGAIRFVGVTLHDAGTPVLDDLSFEAAHGRSVALAGLQSGAATAVVEACLGLRPVDRGFVRVLGLEPAAAVASDRVGSMTRPAGLPDGARVGELIRFVRRVHAAPLAFDELVMRTGLEAIVARPVERLMGDETCRLRLALALAGDPDVVVMDDPGAGLGTGARRELAAEIRRLNAEGRTVLVAGGWDDEIAGAVDRVLLLQCGRPVDEQTALAHDPG